MIITVAFETTSDFREIFFFSSPYKNPRDRAYFSFCISAFLSKNRDLRICTAINIVPVKSIPFPSIKTTIGCSTRSFNQKDEIRRYVHCFLKRTDQISTQSYRPELKFLPLIVASFFLRVYTLSTQREILSD